MIPRNSNTSPKAGADGGRYDQVPLHPSGSASTWMQLQRYDHTAMTSAHKESYMSETINEVDQRERNAQRRSPGYYCTGRVFATSAHEPRASVTSVLPPHPAQGIHMPQRLDRWVVLKSGSDLSAPDSDSYFLALKISTYSGQGVGKRGVVKANHGIIYSGTRCSETSEYELPSRAELGMLRYPIRVQMASKSEKLDPMSRLDYGKTYTFQVSSLVYDLGIVHRDSIPALVGQFRQVLHRLAGGGERNTEGADDDSEASEDELEEEA